MEHTSNQQKVNRQLPAKGLYFCKNELHSQLTKSGKKIQNEPTKQPINITSLKARLAGS
jgi:hypothetical protein